MSHDYTTPPRGGPPQADDPDHLPEHVYLAPVRRFQSAPRALVGGLVIGVALLTLYVGRDSLIFALQSSTPEELGSAQEALGKGSLKHNRYVALTARPILESEGRSSTADTPPGCLRGPVVDMRYTLVAQTGDRLVLRTRESLRATQQIPKEARFTGRILTLSRLPDVQRMYRRFIYRLTDCRSRPKECERRLLVGTDISRETLLPLLGKSEARVRSVEGHQIELSPKTPLFLLFEYPEDWDYQVHSASKEEAISKVKALSLPWIWLETRAEDQLFVIRAPKAKAEAMIQAQRRGGGYGISARLASFLVTFDQLGQRSDTLVIQRVGPGFPEDYVVQPSQGEGEPPTLAAVPHADRVAVPLGRFVKASYHGPRHLPDDAFLLLEGQSPRQAWAALVTAALAIVATGFGVALVLLGLRRPRRGR